MKNLRTILIYGVLGVFCLAALATTLVSRGIIGGAKPAASAAASGQGSAREKVDLETRVAEIMKRSGEIASEAPVVGIGQGKDYARTTQTALKNAGGLAGLVRAGDTVLIKPNICVMAKPDDPRVTDYRVVAEIADEARKLGASRIIVAEGSFSGYTFDAAGYDRIEGVEILDFNGLKKEDCLYLKPEKSLTGKEIPIPRIYMEADVVVNVAKMKTHFQPEARVSLSLKNSFGVPPVSLVGFSYKNDLHSWGLKESVVDLNRIRRPDMNVIDGIVAGEGYGPSSNTPVDARIILASFDPVALDAVAARYMGYAVEEIPHLKLAMDEGLGVGDLAKIQVVGANIDRIKKEKFAQY